MFQIAEVEKVDKKVVSFVRICCFFPKVRYFTDQERIKRKTEWK